LAGARGLDGPTSLCLLNADNARFVTTGKPPPDAPFGAGKWQKESLDIVHTLGFGLGCTDAGLTRIAYVFGSSQGLQGAEGSSSPTSGTVFSQVRGFFAAACGQNLTYLDSKV
jgi:hypothetical protein